MRITGYRIGVALTLTAAAASLVAGTNAYRETTEQTSRQGVQSVVPADGSTAIRQSPISADLVEGSSTNGVISPGYVGELYVNGYRIPDDQLDIIGGLAKYTFVPGPDKDITEMSAGRNCATIRYWRSDLVSDTAQNYNWCFTTS